MQGQSYWNDKLGLTLYNGITSLIGLCFLVYFRYKDVYRLSYFLLFGSYLIMATVGSVYNFPNLDLEGLISWFRIYSDPFKSGALVEPDSTLLSYHMPGFISLVAMSLVIRENKLDGIKSRIIFVIALLLMIISGARQMLFIAVIIFVLIQIRTSGFRALMFASSILAAALALSTREQWLDFMLGSSFNQIVEQSGRLVHFTSGIESFVSAPLFGIGYKFQSYGFDSKWPHNLLVEILAETGLVGLLVVIWFVLLISSTRDSRIRFIGNSFLPLIFIFRALVSGSLATNILVLVIPFFFWKYRYE